MRQVAETYYLAGSWKKKDACRHIAATIERETGMPCVSTWMDSDGDDNDDGDRYEGARQCLDDLDKAFRLVVLLGDSTSPGKHVEIGYALAKEMPIHLVEAPWATEEQLKDLTGVCVFYHLADSVTDLDTFIKWYKARAAE